MNCPTCPTVAETVEGATLIDTSARPVPLKGTVCGEFVALSEIVINPLRGPIDVGAKVTLIVQLVLATRFAPQVFVCAKSPLAAILVSVSPTEPVFMTVML